MVRRWLFSGSLPLKSIFQAFRMPEIDLSSRLQIFYVSLFARYSLAKSQKWSAKCCEIMNISILLKCCELNGAHRLAHPISRSCEQELSRLIYFGRSTAFSRDTGLRWPLAAEVQASRGIHACGYQRREPGHAGPREASAR